MIDLIIFCFCTACLSHFFQITLQEGMIFEWYGKLLEKIPSFFAKPLGSCIVCNGAWIFVLFYSATTILGFSTRGSDSYFGFLIVLFLGIGINYIWIEVIGKYINQ